MDSDPQLDINKIRRIMQARGFNQSKLATYVGVTDAVISQLLSGKQVGLNYKTFIKLSRILKVDPNDLLRDEDSEQAEIEGDPYAQFLEEVSPEELEDYRAINRILREHPKLRRGIAALSGRRPGYVRRHLEQMLLDIEELEREDDEERKPDE